MAKAKAVSTSLALHSSIALSDGTLFQSFTQYRQTMRSLQYLFLTKLDIASVVNKLS